MIDEENHHVPNAQTLIVVPQSDRMSLNDQNPKVTENLSQSDRNCQSDRQICPKVTENPKVTNKSVPN